MKKILSLSALSFFLLTSISLAAENNINNTSSSTPDLSGQIEVVGAQETDLVTENKNTLEVIDNEDISDNENINDDEENVRENHHERYDNEENGDEKEIILFLVGALSGFLGLAFGIGGTLFYLRKKNNK